jgi:site-specific DNA-methyltransferase (adenine-specific)
MEILPTFADASFDSIVTDPPYELGFMGKGWDSSGIAYDVDVWRECLRVLKPGGHLLAFGGSRTWHRMAVAIEDAGFEMRDSIAWLYGSGFPKSMNVAKAIASGTGRPEDIRRLNMGDAYEPSGRGRVNYDNGGGSKMNGAPLVDVDLPEVAQEWKGWGTALKPAFEPIVVARKPFRDTVAANVLVHGAGALNIDATRTGDQPAFTDRKGGVSSGGIMNDTEGERVTSGGAGRWPTNVLLDETQAEALDAQTGVLTSGKLAAHHARAPKEAGILGAYGSAEGERGYGDSGGPARFFYQPKTSTAER